MSGSRSSRVGLSVLLLAGVETGSVVGAMAVNAASARPRWPGPLDVVRQHPFGVLAVVTVVLIGLGVWLWHRDHSGASDGPASAPAPSVGRSGAVDQRNSGGVNIANSGVIGTIGAPRNAGDREQGGR